MIELYTWPTPNGHKVHIMLEELGLKYNVHAINIGAGDQFDPAYLKLNPNNKMPTIVDTEGPNGRPFTVFESGAILIYLAEKHGKFLPKDAAGRSTVIQWVMFQMGAIGPMFGQAHHFRSYAPEKIQYAIDRYTNESGRIYGVVERRLKEVEYLAGDYSIADMAAYPWMLNPDRKGQNADDFPNVKRWLAKIGERPAVVRGMKVLAERRSNITDDKKAREILFGAAQYQRR
jgi:GST-like protein